MAFYDEKKDQDQPVIDGQAVTAGPALGGGTIEGQGTNKEQGPSVTEATTGGTGGFAGINDYINANKPQIASVASQVGSYVEGLGNTARKDIAGAEKGYNAAAQAGTVNYNEGLANEVATGQGSVGVAGNATKAAEFQKMRTGQYAGPQSYESTNFYQPTQQAIQNVNEASVNTLSSQGQQNLLANMQKASRGGQVNRGALGLDLAILRGDKESTGILQNAVAGQKDIQGLQDATKQKTVAATQKGKDITAATNKRINDTFGHLAGDIDAEVVKRAQDQIRQSEEQAITTINALKEGATPTSAQLSLLGVSQQQWDSLNAARAGFNTLYGGSKGQKHKGNEFGDLSKYGQRKDASSQINKRNVTTQDEFAKHNALSSLMGQKGTLEDPTGTKADTDSVGMDYGAAYDQITQGIKDYVVAPEDDATGNDISEGDRGSLQRGKMSIADKINSFIKNPLGVSMQEIKQLGDNAVTATKKAKTDFAVATKKAADDAAQAARVAAQQVQAAADKVTAANVAREAARVAEEARAAAGRAQEAAQKAARDAQAEAGRIAQNLAQAQQVAQQAAQQAQQVSAKVGDAISTAAQKVFKRRW